MKGFIVNFEAKVSLTYVDSNGCSHVQDIRVADCLHEVDVVESIGVVGSSCFFKGLNANVLSDDVQNQKGKMKPHPLILRSDFFFEIQVSNWLENCLVSSLDAGFLVPTLKKP